MSKFHSILSAKASFLILSAEKMRKCGNSKQIFSSSYLSAPDKSYKNQIPTYSSF